MHRDTRTQLIALVALGGFLVGSVAMTSRVSDSVGQNRLAFTQRAADSDPPQVGLGIAMGAFRGLFVNLLWIRANHLKEEGRYYEAMELSNAITKLQPRFPRVWAFHAWNMAYNISVTTQTLEERWQWVESGIRLLREEGVVYNPNDIMVHRELAWIFLHKVGGWTDDANRYYKQQLALEWETVLGEPPKPSPDMRTPEQAVEAFVEWFRPIAEAPRSLEAVYEAEPTASTLVDRLRNEVGETELGYDLLRRYTVASLLGSADDNEERVRSRFSEAALAFQRIYNDESMSDAFEALIPYVRRKMRVEEYNMQPGRMLHFFRKYGPLDYRHPAAHAVYWAGVGVENALARIDERNQKDIDIVNTDRIVIQSIQELYRSGQVYLNYLAAVQEDPNALLAMPNPLFADSYGRTVEEIIERSRFDRIAGTKADGRGRIWSFYVMGYENFLKDVTRLFYRRGQLDLANKYYTILRTYPAMNLNDPERRFQLSKPIEEFVADQFEEFRAYSPHVASSDILAALQGAYLALAAGDEEMFSSQFRYAANFHRYYMEKQRRTVVVDQQVGPKAVMNPDFRIHSGTVFAQFIASLDLESASVLYFRADDVLKRYAYQALLDAFGERAEEVQLTTADGRVLGFNALFPEPPGMEAWRRDVQARLERQRQLELNIQQQ